MRFYTNKRLDYLSVSKAMCMVCSTVLSVDPSLLLPHSMTVPEIRSSKVLHVSRKTGLWIFGYSRIHHSRHHGEMLGFS